MKVKYLISFYPPPPLSPSNDRTPIRVFIRGVTWPVLCLKASLAAVWKGEAIAKVVII